MVDIRVTDATVRLLNRVEEFASRCGEVVEPWIEVSKLAAKKEKVKIESFLKSYGADKKDD